MQDSARHVGVVERVLYLKSLPTLSEIAPGDLAVIAENLDERFFGAGRQVFSLGEFADCIYFVVSGLVVVRGNSFVRTARARDVIGADAVFEEGPYFDTANTQSSVLALALRGDDLFDILEDNFTLTRGLIRALARRLMELRKKTGRAVIPGDGVDRPFTVRAGPMNFIDRIIMMKSTSVLADATVDEVARIAREVKELHLEPGEALFREGDAADRTWFVVRGKIGPFGPRTFAGAIAVFAQMPHAFAAIADEPSDVLVVPNEALFDLMEDHFGMARRMIRNFSRSARMLVAELGEKAKTRAA